MEGLLAFLRSHEGEVAVAALRDGGELDAWRACFGPAVLRYTSWAERQARERLLARLPADGTVGERLAAEPLGAYAGVGAGLRLVDTSGRRRAVLAGCGPLPDTLVYLHEHTAFERLVGIDRDPDAARLAREFVQSAGLHRIEIAEADAAAYDYGDADLVFVSVFATPRRPVVERIAATARPGAAILLRDPVHAGTLLFEPIAHDLPAGLRVVATAPPHGGPFMLGYYALTPSAGTRPRRGRTGP